MAHLVLPFKSIKGRMEQRRMMRRGRRGRRINRKTQLKVFRDLVEGCYQTELVLTEGTISPLSFQDVIVDVRRLFS